MTSKTTVRSALGIFASCAFGICLATGLASSQAGAATAPLAELLASELNQAERTRFIAARKALSRGDTGRFNELEPTLEHYVLHDHLLYERYQYDWERLKPGKAQIQALNAFEKKTGNRELTRRLTRTLQKRFAETEQWSTFLGVSESQLAGNMPCYSLAARSNTGKLNGFDDEALELWIQPRDHDEVCADVLSALEKRHTPSVKAIWERVYAAMEADKPQYAESVLRYLSSRDKAQVKRWIASLETPGALLTSGALDEDSVLNRRIVADLLIAWSKEDTPAAINHWLKIRDNYTFFRDRYYETHRALAMRAAYRRLPEAYEWLDAVKARDDDLELKEWRVRAALLAKDWPQVMRSIYRLPKEEQEEDHWAYWEARALESAGHIPQANAIYQKLAELQSYHGFLAADRLGSDYSITDVPIEPSSDILAALGSEPGLVRAREYNFVDLQHESRREWNNWLRDRTPAELAAAAVLADQWMLYDRAIYTAGQAEQKRAISLRFPVLYRTEVANAAVEHRIDPAWIFGVMRRESAYIRDVRSGAGAIGLMQLMPRTAKYVARLQGDKHWRGDLTDAQTNIGFGTFYLRYVMDKFDDHQVLATASYNAGPHRVDKWLPESGMEADIWIDTIPYTETRRYVRAVLAYTAIYEYHLTQKPQRLSSKLKPIPAAPGA